MSCDTLEVGLSQNARPEGALAQDGRPDGSLAMNARPQGAGLCRTFDFTFAPSVGFYYRRPDGVSLYHRPDGTSLYLRP